MSNLTLKQRLELAKANARNLAQQVSREDARPSPSAVVPSVPAVPTMEEVVPMEKKEEDKPKTLKELLAKKEKETIGAFSPSLPDEKKEKTSTVENEEPKATLQVTSLKERMAAMLAARSATSSSSQNVTSTKAETSPLEKKEGSPVRVEINEDGSIELKEETSLMSKSDVTFADLNERQKLAVELASSGKSFVLIGSAGSGKTTTQRVILQKLLTEGKLKELPAEVNSKYLPQGGASVLITSFTKVATRNIREAAPLEFKKNCVNIHKAVEFAPTKVSKEVILEDGSISYIESMRFTPQKNRFDPLKGITHCIVEEAGSLDVGLFLQLADALPEDCVYIFLGDLNQLPPVYGAAILGFAINKLPVVELTEVYRQNIGPIKELASLILEGKPIRKSTLLELEKESREGATLELNWFKSRNKDKFKEALRLNKGLGDFLKKEVLTGKFIEGKSVVLTPIRKQTDEFLTIFEINKHIAQAFTELRGGETYEIKSRTIGGGSHYYSIGDLVFFEREYYRIADIEVNRSYTSTFGMDFKMPSLTLNRWGVDTAGSLYSLTEGEEGADLDALLDGEIENLLQIADDSAESKNLISHKLRLEQWEVDEDEIPKEVLIESAGDLAALQLGYAQTVHSSQGSEWDTVYLLSPDNVNFMFKREMLYTGVTRARTKLVVWGECGTLPHNFSKGTFEAGVRRQAIKGDSLRDKRKHFRKLGEEKETYKFIPRLMESLNLTGRLPVEGFYSLNDNNDLELLPFF